MMPDKGGPYNSKVVCLLKNIQNKLSNGGFMIGGMDIIR